MTRCFWCGTDPFYCQYHDEEWGVPVWDDQRLFEFLVLEGAQSGLSWITILRKRENYRAAFDHFDPHKVARYGSTQVESLLQNAGIIRNRKKIESAIKNAQAFLKIQEEFGSFAKYQWGFVDGTPIINALKDKSEIQGQTPLSVAWAKDLKQRGFSFLGPVVVYSHMQAAGMVNDHLVDCFRWAQLGGVDASNTR